GILLTRDLIRALAFKMKMLRRRGVYPQVINIFWFLLAFTISLATAFSNLEDNLIGYCLALSLLLLWLPVLVIVALVDRNSMAPMRCKVSYHNLLCSCENFTLFSGIVR